MSPARKRLPPEQRRQQILQQALHLFAQQGFENVSMADIAAALTIGRPTIYIYFASTQEMLDVLFDDMLAKLWHSIEPLVRQLAQHPSPALIRQIFDIVLNEPDLLAILRCGGPAFQRQRLLKFDRQIRPLVEPYLLAHNQPFLLPILAALIEGLAVWAAQESLQDTSALSAALEHFIGYGMLGQPVKSGLDP